ncbi:MAG TPA: (2,3-dihydroxybenzoyl)adenylate synthase [Cellvibrio sp.]|nr:(2,3-dihydroxybenzoyl)adenylate synthase [Cellvibrio sp.]
MEDLATATHRDFTPWPAELQAHYRAKGYWTGEPLGDLLRNAASTEGTRTAIIAGDKQWTYEQLDLRADQLAAGFIAFGLKPGARVVVQMPNSGELFEVLFALFRIGVAPILALPSHRFAEINYFYTFAEADAYITCDTWADFDYRELARKLRDNRATARVIITGDAAEFCSLASLYQTPIALPRMDAGRIALYQLSGGTTGVPKLIPRTHDDYYYSVRASAEICGLNPASVYLAVLPVVHNFPLSSPGALGVLWAGATLVLASSGAPDIAFPLIEQHQVTITAMVPPLALTWLVAAENRQRDGKPPKLQSLELLQVGGAKFSEEVARRVKTVLGCKLQQVFGMAEGLVNYTRLDDSDHLLVSTQGRPISPDDEIRIVDDMDNPVAPGTTGNLLTRGPYTIRGYFRAAEHNAKAFTEDGFYRTGDLVRITAEGYLVVEGRVKDQINRGGEKISAEEIENHLLAHPEVQDVALVAMPDPYLGERSCAFVALRARSMSVKRSDLLHFLHSRELAAYKIPDHIEFIPALPQTRLGKVDKKYLREWIAEKNAQRSAQ